MSAVARSNSAGTSKYCILTGLTVFSAPLLPFVDHHKATLGSEAPGRPPVLVLPIGADSQRIAVHLVERMTGQGLTTFQSEGAIHRLRVACWVDLEARFTLPVLGPKDALPFLDGQYRLVRKPHSL